MKEPLVTVCISTYNRGKLLPFVIECVQKQTYKNIEILVIDDCSTDETQNIVSELKNKDSRLYYHRHQQNRGLSSGRNTAIKNAKGKYFTFIDDDDKWEPKFIADFVELAEQYDDNWCFCCGNKHVDVFEKVLCLIPKLEGSLKQYIKKGYTPPVAAQFYFTKSLKMVGGYNEKIKSGVDHDLWLTLACNKFELKSLEKPLAIPNTNVAHNRMTTNYKKRLNGILNSLKLWEEDIVNSFGKNFYRHFKKAYLYYLYKDFFTKSLSRKQFLKAFFYYIKSPNKLYLLWEILRSGLKVIFKRNNKKGIQTEILKPTFLPFKD